MYKLTRVIGYARFPVLPKVSWNQEFFDKKIVDIEWLWWIFTFTKNMK
jgi:hypothetical protein